MRRNINALGLDLDALRQFEWNDSNWSVDLSYGFRADGIESFDYLKAIDGYFSTCEMQNIDCENIDCENIDCENIDCAYIDSDKIESMEIMVWIDEQSRVQRRDEGCKMKDGVISGNADFYRIDASIIDVKKDATIRGKLEVMGTITEHGGVIPYLSTRYAVKQKGGPHERDEKKCQRGEPNQVRARKPNRRTQRVGLLLRRAGGDEWVYLSINSIHFRGRLNASESFNRWKNRYALAEVRHQNRFIRLDEVGNYSLSAYLADRKGVAA